MTLREIKEKLPLEYIQIIHLIIDNIGEKKFKQLSFTQDHIDKWIDNKTKRQIQFLIEEDREFIEAVKMLNEDKDKAISIYGDPETWSTPGISNISIAESKDEIVEPSEFEIKFKGFKEVDGNTKVSDLVKLNESTEVYLVVKKIRSISGFCQYKNDNSKLTDFGCLKSALDANYEDYGVFNPLKEIYRGEVFTSDCECNVLPLEDMIDYLGEELPSLMHNFYSNELDEAHEINSLYIFKLIDDWDFHGFVTDELLPYANYNFNVEEEYSGINRAKSWESFHQEDAPFGDDYISFIYK